MREPPPAVTERPQPRRFPNLLRNRAALASPTADPHAPAWSRPLAPLDDWLEEAQRLIDRARRRA